MLSGTAYPKMHSHEHKGDSYINGGQVIPAVTYPFGMTQWTLQTQYSERKKIAPFYSGKLRFQGFRGTHWLNGTDGNDYGSVTICPTNLSDHRFLPHQRETMFMYNTETSTPAYMSVLMPEQNIMTEITATKRCAIFTISWLDPKLPSVIFDVNSDEGKGFIKIDTEKNEIYGYNPVFVGEKECKKPAGIAGYFVIKFNQKLKDFGTYSGMAYVSGETEKQNEKNIGAYITFDLKKEEAVMLKVGTSFTSIENARKNLEAEIPGWNFNSVRNELEDVWNASLGKIDVESENKENMTIFYTSLYRCLLQPRLYSDVNGEYRGFGKDTTVHVADGFDYYGDFATWNTYRAQMPLISLIMPHEYRDMVRSLIVKAEQGGKLPLSTFCNNYGNNSEGDYCSSVIADAYVKGFHFDIDKAYGFMRENAFGNSDFKKSCDIKGRPYVKQYMDYGYIPIDITGSKDLGGGEVTLTVDYSFNDYSLAKVAKMLGRKKDHEKLLLRSYNYTNLFDEDRQSVCAKYVNDTFTDDFVADEMMPYTIEGTPEQYTFFAPHDVKGLVELFGGKKVFENKLDDIISQNKLWPGNEPGQIIPYLYGFIGKWDKTQMVVRNILRQNYSTTIDGYVRNDKGAQMSAWYVFSSMGFYPVCPVCNEYRLSAPLFDKITLSLDEDYYPGDNFVIKAQKPDINKPYLKVEYNGQQMEPFISFEDLIAGGELLFSR